MMKAWVDDTSYPVDLGCTVVDGTDETVSV